MNLRSFREKIEKKRIEANGIDEVLTITQQKVLLAQLIILLTKQFEFLQDEQNISVLEQYEELSKKKQEVSPINNFCRDIIEIFEEFEALIDSMPFYETRPENEQSFPNTKSIIPALSQNSAKINVFMKRISILSAFKVLKHLIGHGKTLIVLGANGSGKTSLANYLKTSETHIKVIPATKPIKAMGFIPSIYNSTIETYQSEVFEGGDLKEDLLQKLIIGLCKEHDNAARTYLNTGNKADTLFNKVKRIFDSFFNIELDDSNFGEKQVQGKAENSLFPFNNMSDGERAAFFYIATVIIAPLNSFIVVDEPENHLNPAIYNKIWDKLIEERNDCQFIFISHTMEFINARTNYELVKIKNFAYPDTFDFEFLGDSLENLDSEVIVELVGSRKPILFCEGSKTGYDFKIYEKLFGNEYTVIPTGTCIDVVNSVEACNKYAGTYSISSAIGIIDSDLKREEEIEQLKGKQIYPLKYNEVEMLLLDESIFKKALVHVFKEETEFESFRNRFFDNRPIAAISSSTFAEADLCFTGAGAASTGTAFLRACNFCIAMPNTFKTRKIKTSAENTTVIAMIAITPPEGSLWRNSSPWGTAATVSLVAPGVVRGSAIKRASSEPSGVIQPTETSGLWAAGSSVIWSITAPEPL